MYIDNRLLAPAARLLASAARLLTAAAAIAGLAILGVAGGGVSPAHLLYFTNLSNAACVLLYAVLLVKPSFVAPRLKGCVLMMLFVTMIIYHFMLSATGFVMQANLKKSYVVANTLLHYIAPCLALLEWALFDKKGRFTWTDPLLWLLSPVLYFAFIMLRGASGAVLTGPRYPYYFLDVDAIGAAGVAAYAAAFAFAFAALGYIIVVIDVLLAKYINPAPRS